MLVKEIMNRDIIYVSPETSVKEIFKIMIILDTPFLPVLDSNKNIAGYVLEKTLLSRMKLYKTKKGENLEVHLDHNEFIKEQRKLYGGTAKDVMETDIITIDENMNVVDVVELMLVKNMFRFTVARKNKIVGCITSHDILEALYYLEEGRKMEDMSPTDEDLKYKIHNAVKRNLDVHISRLVIHVKDGNVSLNGSAGTVDDYKAVEDIVNSIPGVKSVSNSLIIEKMLE